MTRRGRLRLLGSCAAVLLASSSCLFGGVHDRCHRRALEQLGCCPFHGEECGGELALDSIKKACAEELSSLEGMDETGDELEPDDELEDDGSEDPPGTPQG